MHGKITYLGNRNPWTDRYKILHVGFRPGRNHACNFLWRSVKGFWCGEGSNLGLFLWLASSPLKHSRTTVRVCDWLKSLRCCLFWHLKWMPKVFISVKWSVFLNNKRFASDAGRRYVALARRPAETHPTTGRWCGQHYRSLGSGGIFWKCTRELRPCTLLIFMNFGSSC